MSRYLQTTTANPYGHRPWATRLYTGFENYAFLKQPQNTIIREDVNMRPEIYRPPELKKPAGVGSFTLVSGSGRVIRRRTLRGLGAIPLNNTMVFRGVFPIWRQPLPIINPPPPPQILPPSMVPPVPQPVYSGPGGIVYALPGDASTPGSPFAPSTIPVAPGAVPAPSGSAAVAAAATPPSSLSTWFNGQDYIAGVPNGYLAIAGVGALLFMSSRKSKR